MEFYLNIMVLWKGNYGTKIFHVSNNISRYLHWDGQFFVVLGGNFTHWANVYLFVLHLQCTVSQGKSMGMWITLPNSEYLRKMATTSACSGVQTSAN